MARLFRRIKDAVKATNSETKLFFNVPFRMADDRRWVDHPMVNETDLLFAECTNPDVLDWLLKIKKPEQRVMTTVVGHHYEGWCEVDLWRNYYEKGVIFSDTPGERLQI
jgi:hypothetical protein